MARTTDIDVPDLSGKLAIVTGASDGIGFNSAARLARAGAEVLMPVRNQSKGDSAAERIRSATPEAKVEVRTLDLASLDSVATFTDQLVGEGRPVDILINNAGLMTPPTRQLTVDDNELQFGTNHLGHFALATRLLPAPCLATRPDSRGFRVRSYIDGSPIRPRGMSTPQRTTRCVRATSPPTFAGASPSSGLRHASARSLPR